MVKQFAFILHRERCKGCGLCAAFCSRGLLRPSEKLNSLGYYPVEMTDVTRCNGCGACSMVCPDLAIFVQREEKTA